MNISICERCKHFNKLPLRYKCNLYYVDVKHYKRKDKTRYAEELCLKDTFLKHKVPHECPYQLKDREENICFNCKHLYVDRQRVKCKNINSWSYINFYNKIKINNLNNKCPYEFEQTMCLLNE